MLLAHKIELDPNNRQATYFAKAAGVARVAYNWALASWKTQYEAGGKPNEIALRKQLNGLKDEQFPWMREVTKVAPQQAIKDLGSAFKHFFRRVKLGEKPGYPRFKKRGIHDSFRADNGPARQGAHAVAIDGKRINLPRIGWVRMREALRFTGQVKSVTVSKRGGRWFAAILVNTDERSNAPRENQGGVVGVDLGVAKLATLSTGEVVEGPKPLKRLLKVKRRLSKAVSRKVKGSQNRRKAVQQLNRLHYRIANIRSDALHKLTTMLATTFSIIGIETLNVRGMMANHCLARAVSDMGFHEFRRQLEYKAAWYGARIVNADMWYPSTKTCSSCGAQNDMPLSKRRMVCECGLNLDRDLNAAINLRDLAASSAVTACGEGSTGRVRSVKLPSVKQESNSRVLDARIA